MKEYNDKAVAGNYGGRVRSDCQVMIEPTRSGGIDIEIQSKVKTLYGREMTDQIRRAMDFFGVRNARVVLFDSGALPWVIDARLEAAARAVADVRKSLLPPTAFPVAKVSARDRRRCSRLYLPGNSPSLMINAYLHQPDGLILDLEDAVAPDKKPEARVLVRNALRSLNFGEAEKMVRINQGAAGLDDLDWVVPHGVDLILLPKCERPEAVTAVAEKIGQLRAVHGIDQEIWIMPIIESALGIENAFGIASASPSVVALAIGLEDFTADLGVVRTLEGTESLYARSALVNACKAAGIQAIDSVFSDVDDMEGLKANVLKSKAMGFDGMGCIHPRQIRVIQENFAPGLEEIEKAKKIVLAFMEARKKGLSVVALGSKMIDPPVVKRAEKVIGEAIQLGMMAPDWFTTME
ncbi:MAG: aldolase/citrate lyase family protein [Bacteroidales bacterium]